MKADGEACPWCGRDPLVPSGAPLVVATICAIASIVVIASGDLSYAQYAVDAVGWLFPME